MLARMAQLSDVFADARKMIDKGFYNIAFCGDLNTMAMGIARLSPKYCRDRMRLRSIGKDEAVVWEQHILSVRDPRYEPSEDGKRIVSHHEKDRPRNDNNAAGLPIINSRLLGWGVREEFARDVVNPGFACPFDGKSTVTLDNPRYKLFGISFMRGKLDWILLRQVAVEALREGNADFALSDHKWLLVEGKLLKPE